MAACLLMLSLLISCQHKEAKPFHADKVKSNDTSINAPAAGNVLSSYLEIKDALIAGNEKSAIRHATEMSHNLDKLIVPGQISENAGISVKEASIQQLKTQLQNIIATSDCEKQRVAFQPLSDTLVNFIKNFQLRDVHLYHLYCPMAFNEAGAWWLSNSSEIRNPYFGTKMLTCGELVDSLP